MATPVGRHSRCRELRHSRLARSRLSRPIERSHVCWGQSTVIKGDLVELPTKRWLSRVATSDEHRAPDRALVQSERRGPVLEFSVNVENHFPIRLGYRDVIPGIPSDGGVGLQCSTFRRRLENESIVGRSYQSNPPLGILVGPVGQDRFLVYIRRLCVQDKRRVVIPKYKVAGPHY
jgi:hypothetical protein